MHPEMNATSSFIRRHSRALRRWCAFPLIGNSVHDFVQWLKDRGYADTSVGLYLSALPSAVCRWRRNGIESFEQLTMEAVSEAQRYFLSRDRHASSAVRCFRLFLIERKLLPEATCLPHTPSTLECISFAKYMRNERGLAARTIKSNVRSVGRFLTFLGYDRDRSRLRRLTDRRINAFLHHVARTNSRFSMQAVVANIRAFLRHKHAQGVISRPLHLQIDTPKGYGLERLPKALPWAQVQGLLRSIDRSGRLGLRDFSLLYLAAAYGLRSCEVVGLTLEDIDWRARVLRVAQSKTRRTVELPLTDEAAMVLIDYLRKARPLSNDRHLFLRSQAPAGPLTPTVVSQALKRRIHLSGLKLPPTSSHALRHSFAVHLLRQGVDTKSIGDTLGHRDIHSTHVYLRLGLEDLQSSAMPMPTSLTTRSVAESTPTLYKPCHRAVPSQRTLPKRFQSVMAGSLRRFIRLKRALGCRYHSEAVILARWDDFLHRLYPKARRATGRKFSAWTTELCHLSPKVQAAYQRVVRNFLIFHAREHTGTFIPNLSSLPKSTPPPFPRLVSHVEMAHILDLARELPPSFRNPLRAETFRLGLTLLFCCGLRRNELLRLTLGHIDLEQSLLRIENTKFYKSRLVPLSPTVADEVAWYLRQRHRKKFCTNPRALFLTSCRDGDKAYTDSAFLRVWHQLCLRSHLLDGHGRPPRLHDLRHSFAVNTLQRWYAEGANVQSRLPHLATYLGHVNIASTHYYLKLTPELREKASQLFHQRFAPLFADGGLA